MSHEGHQTTPSKPAPLRKPPPRADDFDAVVEFFRSWQGELPSPTSLPSETGVVRAVYPKSFGDVILAAEVLDVELPKPTPEDVKEARVLQRKLEGDRFDGERELAKEPR